MILFCHIAAQAFSQLRGDGLVLLFWFGDLDDTVSYAESLSNNPPQEGLRCPRIDVLAWAYIRKKDCLLEPIPPPPYPPAPLRPRLPPYLTHSLLSPGAVPCRVPALSGRPSWWAWVMRAGYLFTGGQIVRGLDSQVVISGNR